MKNSIKRSLPHYLITYAQPERFVMGYTVDLNALRWIIRNAPHNANLEVIEYNSMEDLERDAEVFDSFDDRVFSHELISNYDSEGNIYPPVFGDDDYISDLVWENFKTDVDITSYKIIELLKFVVDSDIAELLSKAIRMIKYLVDEESKPHPISYWNDDHYEYPFDISMIEARFLSSEEGGLMYYYGDY